ncbi:hypothetical protein [Streptomyces sp. NPDC001893]|uniref:hypothetical protein n=1 Tax=Streptomyces sp. NPDC001893 TaxID=3154530 RepID=UPI0033270961
MLSVALGRAAVDAGHRACFTTAPELTAKCHRAATKAAGSSVRDSSQTRSF